MLYGERTGENTKRGAYAAANNFIVEKYILFFTVINDTIKSVYIEKINLNLIKYGIYT